MPKPLNLISGTPLATFVLDSIPVSDILVVVSHSLPDVNFESTLPHLARGKAVRCISLSRATRGAVETAYLGLREESALLDRPVVFYDNDTVYDFSGVTFPTGAHFVGVARAADAKEIAPYCYVRCSAADGTVAAVAEKRKISADFAVGVYGFESVRAFLEVAKAVLLGGDSNGSCQAEDFYMSAVYARLLAEGLRVTAVRMPAPLCLGTAEDIERNAPRLPFRPLRFCFDIDNTLVHYKVLPDGAYRDCAPVPRMVELVRALKTAGHFIVLSTARGMATAKSNLGAAQARIAAETFENLSALGIPYDEIYFGKPHADVYIDDKAYNPFFNLFEAIGMPSLELAISRKLLDTRGTLRSNRFNSIERVRGLMHKHGPIASMAGEEFFYRVVQTSPVARYFARYHGSSSDATTISLQLEYIQGCTHYELLRSGLLTRTHVSALMDAMDAVHVCVGIPVTTTHNAVYDNYVTKLRLRISDAERYPYSDVSAVVDALGAYLRLYVDSPRFAVVPIVHGDPWFSNTMIESATSRVVFLDMKGDIAGTLTTNGDALTDFGKLYQSLLGFDGLLEGKPTPETVLSPLREAFLAQVQERGYLLADLQAVTACLIAKTLHFMDVDVGTRASIWAIVRALALNATGGGSGVVQERGGTDDCDSSSSEAVLAPCQSIV